EPPSKGFVACRTNRHRRHQWRTPYVQSETFVRLDWISWSSLIPIWSLSIMRAGKRSFPGPRVAQPNNGRTSITQAGAGGAISMEPLSGTPSQQPWPFPLRGDDGNQTSPDGTKQIILYQSLLGKLSSGLAWLGRYQTIASPTGFSVLITTSGGTGYHSP